MLYLKIEPRREVMEHFFDTREDLSSTYESCPISPVTCTTSPISPAPSNLSPHGNDHQTNLISPGPYKLWIGDPLSVRARRVEFKKWMGLTPSPSPRPPPSFENYGDERNVDELETDVGTSVSNSGVLQSSSSSEIGSSTSVSMWSSQHSRLSEESFPGESLINKIANWDDGGSSLHAELEDSVSSRRFSDVISDQLFIADGVPKTMMPSNFSRFFMRREDNGSTRSSVISSTSSEESIGSKRRSWLKRLGIMACINVDRQEDDEGSLKSYAVDRNTKRVDRVKVHSFWKKTREFAAVYREQDFGAHEGAVWTMKFSPDGRYLASGGEDGIVRVWSVMECQRTGDDLLDGHSCIQLSGNRTPIYIVSEKTKKNSTRKSDSACVVIPPKMFRLSEEPLHQFRGHHGDILDLSWSKDKYLISSSLDKTVRLWQVGCEKCLRVFRHNDFVTCVQFNPIEQNFFISGSIDGKVRIWDISSCHVVDWSDVTELVTAVCFHPDGKGVVVGSIMGNCRFFKIADNCLQVDRDVNLHGKKGSTRKRITGFEFSQSDPTKLLVTSADSHIRVLHKYAIVHKYKGFQNAGSLISASFTKDGRHIISASENSSVFIWSHTNKDASATRASVTRSYEKFFSSEAAVAIPWHGFVTLPSQSDDFSFQTDQSVKPSLQKQPELTVGSAHPIPSSGSSNSGAASFLESLLKGEPPTWPEETLPPLALAKGGENRASDYRLLKNACENISSTPHSWGQVIVTAGCDGRIRVFCNYGLPVQC